MPSPQLKNNICHFIDTSSLYIEHSAEHNKQVVISDL